MFCSILANKIINKINKTVVKLKYKSTKKIPPPPQRKVKGKVYISFVHNTAHLGQKLPSCPPNRNDDCLPCFLYKSFFYDTVLYTYCVFTIVNSLVSLVDKDEPTDISSLFTPRFLPLLCPIFLLHAL